MAQVQLFRGSREKLDKTYLRDGAIYFVPEERQLYIDTLAQRLPIIGVAGLPFYVHLKPEFWMNGSQTVVKYHQKLNSEENEKYILKNVLSNESIIFLGQVYTYNNGEEITPTNFQTIDCVDFNFESGELKFTAYDGAGEVVTGNITEDIWVYIYVPNPIVSGLEIAAPASAITTTKLLRGVGAHSSLEDISGWRKGLESSGEDPNKYYYDIDVEAIDLTSNPFMIGFYDDSLENYRGYWESVIKVVDSSVSYDNSNSHFKLEVKAENLPSLNITIFITVFLGNKVPNEDKYNYVDVDIDLSSITDTEKTFSIDSPRTLSDIEGEDLERVLFCYKPDLDRTDDYIEGKLVENLYNHIIDISYNSVDNNFTIILDTNISELKTKGITETSITILQMNNIANISEDKLTLNSPGGSKPDWQEQEWWERMNSAMEEDDSSEIKELLKEINSNWEYYPVQRTSQGKTEIKKYFLQRLVSAEHSLSSDPEILKKNNFIFKYSPIIYPILDSIEEGMTNKQVEEKKKEIIQEFNKIVEVKVINRNLYFFAKRLPTIDIPIKIVDFL